MLKKPKYYFKCPFCEKGAFLMYEKPVPHTTLTAEKCVFPDGTKPVPHTTLKCFYCKADIPELYLQTERVFKL